MPVAPGAPGAAWETDLEVKNPWGLKNLLTGPAEWNFDWYGEYDFIRERDPVGYAKGFVKVVRGGYLDMPDKGYLPADYQRPSNRAGAPPAFGPYVKEEPNPHLFGLHRIGFRVVAAQPLATTPRPFVPPFARQGVKLTHANVTRDGSGHPQNRHRLDVYTQEGVLDEGPGGRFLRQ